jgi:hypothetical protein
LAFRPGEKTSLSNSSAKAGRLMAAMFLVHSGDMVIKALMVQGCIAMSCVFSLTHYHGSA